MSEVAKIVVNLTKNGRPVKSILKVSPKIKFSSFMERISSYTTKEHKVYYHAEGRQWEELTETALRPLLKNYKNEQINIITEVNMQENQLDNSEISEMTKRPESSLSDKSYSFNNNREEEAPSSQPPSTEPGNLQSAESNSLKGTFLDLATTTLNSASEVVPSVAPQENTQGPQNDFYDTVRDIVRYIAEYITRELQKKYKILREKQQVIELGKTCQECKSASFKGPYFICLVCPGEYVICPNCEADDSMPDKILNTHKEKSHPFAKIKRLNQTIKTKAVTTISESDIGFEIRSERGMRMAQPEQKETDQEIYNQLIKHFQSLYEELLKKSDYHRKVLENPQLIRRLKRGVMHRDNLIPDPGQAQSYGSVNVQSTFEGGSNNISIPSYNDSMQFGVLTEKEKLQKVKKLRRMGIPEELIKKYTSQEYQNMTYKEILKLIEGEPLNGAAS